jgi:hypothetical protein
MPVGQRATPTDTMLFINDMQERLSVVALSAPVYLETLKHCAELGIAGGATYDALIARSALDSGAEKIFTWNVRHYQLLGPEVGRRLQTPEEFLRGIS